MTYKAQQFIDAIPGSGGIITKIATKLGCNWYTVDKAIKKYPSVAAAYQAEKEKILDLAENRIITDMNDTDSGTSIQTVKWYLAKKGKERGYVDQRSEIEHKGDNVVTLRVIYDETTPDD
jgi:hypothetical protein